MIRLEYTADESQPSVLSMRTQFREDFLAMNIESGELQGPITGILLKLSKDGHFNFVKHCVGASVISAQQRQSPPEVVCAVLGQILSSSDLC